MERGLSQKVDRGREHEDVAAELRESFGEGSP